MLVTLGQNVVRLCLREEAAAKEKRKEERNMCRQRFPLSAVCSSRVSNRPKGPKTCLLARPAQTVSIQQSQGQQLCLPASRGTLSGRHHVKPPWQEHRLGFASSLPPPIGSPRCLLGPTLAHAAFSRATCARGWPRVVPRENSNDGTALG